MSLLKDSKLNSSHRRAKTLIYIKQSKCQIGEPNAYDLSDSDTCPIGKNMCQFHDCDSDECYCDGDNLKYVVIVGVET